MNMPKIIAHRGASAHAPENTLAAFQLALEQDADGIELDVMLSADGQVVVIHDETVDRTTNGSGRVKDMTLAQLKQLELGDGEKLPTLDEVFERFGGQFLINIELKNYTSIFDALPIKVANLVCTYGLEDSVLLSSFNPFNLPRLRSRLPQTRLGVITMPHKANFWAWRLFKYDSLHPHFSDVNQELVSSLHARQRQINVWTVDEPDEILRLAGLGVDGIITNDPRRARQVLENDA